MTDIADRLDKLAKGALPLPNTCSEGAAEIRRLREGGCCEHIRKKLEETEAENRALRKGLQWERDCAATLSAENRALRDYIEFLGAAYNRVLSIADIHGFSETEEAVKEGHRLRMLAGIGEPDRPRTVRAPETSEKT